MTSLLKTKRISGVSFYKPCSFYELCMLVNGVEVDTGKGDKILYTNNINAIYVTVFTIAIFESKSGE